MNMILHGLDNVQHSMDLIALAKVGLESVENNLSVESIHSTRNKMLPWNRAIAIS